MRAGRNAPWGLQVVNSKLSITGPFRYPRRGTGRRPLVSFIFTAQAKVGAIVTPFHRCRAWAQGDK